MSEQDISENTLATDDVTFEDMDRELDIYAIELVAEDHGLAVDDVRREFDAGMVKAAYYVAMMRLRIIENKNALNVVAYRAIQSKGLKSN